MRKPEEPDRKLFWSMIVLGLVSVGFGSAFGWGTYAAARQEKDYLRWIPGEAVLREVGIRQQSERHGYGYDMTVLYLLHVNGRDYEGRSVSGGYSKSGVQVRSLLLPFVPDAVKFDLNELGLLKSSQTWPVVFKSVPVRYDPDDPSRSQMLLANPIVSDLVGMGMPLSITAFFLGVGATCLVFAWPARRGKPKPQPLTGPRLREFPEADRQRLLQSLAVLQAQIGEHTREGSTPEARSYAESIEEIAAEARDGSLMPLEHVNSALGRAASEIFNNGRLGDAASTLEACLEELAKRKITR